MIQVYEKRGMWKVSGSSKKYFTKEEALAAASENFEVVKEDTVWHHNIEIKTPEEEEEKDPLEALRQARSKRDGDIEEGSHNDGDHEEQELSESTDRWVFGASRHTSDS